MVQSASVPTASIAMAAPSQDITAIAAGLLGTRSMAPAVRAEGAPKADAVAARDGDAAGTTIQTISFSAQVAPPTSAHARQLPETVSVAKDATPTSGGAAERPNAAAGKTDASAQDAAVPMPVPATIATIADAVSDLAAAPEAAPAPSLVAPPPTLAPARTMVLQLAPADLGTVAVRLHLTGQTLDVQLSVSDPKTLGLVSRERDALAARLDDRGYQLNTLTIQGTDPSASSTAGSHDPSHTRTDTGAEGNQGADGRRRGTSGQSGRQTGERTPDDRLRGGDAAVDRRGLYI